MSDHEAFDRKRPGRHDPFVTPRPEREVDDELKFHLEQRIKTYIASGMTVEAAHRAAAERFGDVEGVREECEHLLTEDRKAKARRDWFDDLRQDLRFAVRSAVRAPLFSLLSVLTLALGIGANAAIFGVVKSVLLDPLPYKDASRLIRILCPFRNGTVKRGSLSAGTISDIRERQRSFVSFGAFQNSRDALFMNGTTPEIVHAMWIEPALLRTLGVSPARGPGFQDADAERDTTTVVLISNAAWQRFFSGDPDIIGKKIQLNNIGRTVVGVLPRDFVPPEFDAEFYQPMSMAPYMRNAIGVRGSHNFGLVGRLKPGVTVEAAQRELGSIGGELERLYPKDNLGIGLAGTPLRDDMVGDTRSPLLILLASAGLVLLIMCANLAGALLSRTISRRKEFAVRVALGAGRGRLVRQLLTESLLLALAGGVAGFTLATLALHMLRGLALTTLPHYANLSLDGGAVAVTFALALLTGLAFGVGPALSVGRSDPQGTLREQTRGSSESARTRRLRGLLVAGQVALCITLLAAAGLLARSLWAMTAAPIGFDAEQLLTFTVQLPGAKYATDAARVQAYDDLLQRLNALPGVVSAANVSSLPTKIGNTNGLFIQDAPWAPNQPVPFILTARVSDNFFHTLSIPLKQGRVFTTADGEKAPPAIIINDAMAKKYWPKGNALGARIHIGPPDPTEPWITVVGIVGNVRNDATRLEPEPIMYLSIRQSPSGDAFVVRAAGDPLSLTSSVRRAIASFDPTLPMYKVSTMRQVIGDGFVARRLPVVLMTAFGALALLLASVGIYAMFATMAAAREREFGVRVALGSTRGAIAGLVLRQGAMWMLVGLAAGTVGVILVARVLQAQLFGVAALDPIAIGAAVVILLVCAGVALMVPVRRASSVDPITVLR
ncbi:MAG: ADOP family duplicated permease [Gemmatimonadaceae bacterium]